MSAVSQMALLAGSRAYTYATLNPSDKATGITLSNGNLTAAGTADVNYRWVRGTIALSGKQYWEMVYTTLGQFNSFGIVPQASAISTNDTLFLTTLGGVAYSDALAQGVGQNSALVTSVGSASTAGDVYMFATDIPNNKYWFGRNGTWFNSGNPGAGTGNIGTSIGSTIMPGISMRYPSGSSAVTFNFGASAFSFSVPSGFNPGVFT